MEELKISPTRKTPEILLMPEGIIRIKGRSIPEDVSDFFQPVEDWVTEYIVSPAEETTVDMSFEYFNSASAKAFIQLLQKITSVKSKHKKYILNWFYEDGDDDILERGEYFSSVLNVPFNFIMIK